MGDATAWGSPSAGAFEGHPDRSGRAEGDGAASEPAVADRDAAGIEGRIAARLIAGDQQALDDCFRRWGRVVYSSALHALGDPGDADDVTQQVFIEAWRSRGAFDPARGALPGWLFGIARHRILDRLRSRGREQALADRYAAAAELASGSEATVDRLLDHLLLVSELAALPDPRGTILRLSLWEGRTHSEIADELGLPLGTVKSHARRGLLRLRTRMEALR